MDSGIFLGIDHGGSTTTTLVFEAGRGKRASHSVPMPKATPGPGLVEHIAEQFVETSLASASGALAKADGDLLTQLQNIKVVRCDEVSLRVFGFSLANWNIVISAGLAGLAGLSGWRR